MKRKPRFCSASVLDGLNTRLNASAWHNIQYKRQSALTRKKLNNHTHKHVYLYIYVCARMCIQLDRSANDSNLILYTFLSIFLRVKYVLIFNASWSCRLRLHIYSNRIPVWFECTDPASTGFTSCLVFSPNHFKRMLTDCLVFYIFISSHPPFSLFFHFSTHQM